PPRRTICRNALRLARPPRPYSRRIPRIEGTHGRRHGPCSLVARDEVRTMTRNDTTGRWGVGLVAGGVLPPLGACTSVVPAGSRAWVPDRAGTTDAAPAAGAGASPLAAVALDPNRPCQDDDVRLICRQTLHHYSEYERTTQAEVYAAPTATDSAVA